MHTNWSCDEKQNIFLYNDPQGDHSNDFRNNVNVINNCANVKKCNLTLYSVDFFIGH